MLAVGLQNGEGCTNCRGIDKCKDIPDEHSAITMACLRCEGRGCELCNNTGRIDIKQCPLEVITDDVWESIEFADLYKKGLPPMPGGALNQLQIFISACRFIWQCQALFKRKLEWLSEI